MEGGREGVEDRRKEERRRGPKEGGQRREREQRAEGRREGWERKRGKGKGEEVLILSSCLGAQVEFIVLGKEGLATLLLCYCGYLVGGVFAVHRECECGSRVGGEGDIGKGRTR